MKGTNISITQSHQLELSGVVGSEVSGILRCRGRGVNDINEGGERIIYIPDANPGSEPDSDPGSGFNPDSEPDTDSDPV